jgi:ribonuclease Z
MKYPHLKITGSSVGSVGTCIMLPGFHLGFDIGTCPEAAIGLETIFITHGHMDHIGAIGAHCAYRRLRGFGPPTYVVPEVLWDDMAALLDSFQRLDGSKMEWHQDTVRPGESWVHRTWVGGANRLEIHPFTTHHTLPSQGYALCSGKWKLKPEYKGLEPEEMISLRKQGKVLEDPVDVVDLAVTGDTTIDVLDDPLVRRARILVMEVTFLDDQMPAQDAYDIGHVHLDHVVEAHRDGMLEHEFIYLTHFSNRYDHTWGLIRKGLPDDLLARVRFLG